MHKPRRAYETGHRPKFLALVDENAEGDRALRFAARRARRVGAIVVLLAIVEPGEEAPQLLGVADLIRDEAMAKAEANLAAAAALVRAAGAGEPETLIVEGEKAVAIPTLIDADEDVALLILAAPPGRQGPGLLVNTLLKADAQDFPLPIAIVPAGLSDAEIDAVA
jgi:nucleotide-binding universal stress UspA family protein